MEAREHKEGRALDIEIEQQDVAQSDVWKHDDFRDSKISESIFNGFSVTIPMADVQHIEKHWYGKEKKTKHNYRGIKIITKHTRWDFEADCWMNDIYLDREEADKFMKSWCVYISELESLK